MIRFKFLTIIIIFLLPLSLFSQINVTGKIIDNDSIPLEFAEVILLTKDSIGIKGELSNEKGDFLIDGPKGIYIIQIRQVGKILYTTVIELSNNIDLGIIKVETSHALQEIVVQGNKKLIEKKVDRLVFNVASSIASSGGDALDVLRILPRIKVQNEKISMIGKSGMAVMVDNIIIPMSGDDLTNFLKTIKSDDIESIEIISNPPAKYNSEGNSGLINIRMKKAKNNSWSASLRTIYKQATYSTSSNGGNFEYQKGRLYLSSDINYIKGSIASVTKSNIFYPNLLWSENVTGRDYTESFSGRIGLDYKVSGKLITGIKYNNINSFPNTKDNIRSEIINSSSQEVDSLILTKARNTTKKISNTFNYHIIYQIDSSEKKLSFDFDYFNYKLNSERLFASNTIGGANYTFSSANNIGLQQINNYSFNTDMEHPLKWVSLNYGGRISATRTNNNLNFFDLETGVPVLDTDQSNEFIFDENTQAIYLSAQKEINEKWEAKLGLRFENTHTKGYSKTYDAINRINYRKLLPTAYLTYSVNEDNSFSLNYGKRIIRPSFGLLNPFKRISSPYSYSEGNPYLLPAFTDNIEIDHSYKDLFTTSVYFSYLNNGFEWLTIADTLTKVQQTVSKNFVENYMFGVNESISYSPFKWVTINFYADVYYSDTRSKLPVTLNFLKSWNGEFTFNSGFVLNNDKTLLFNISYIYATRGVDNLHRNTSFSQLSVSLKASVLQKKLQITLYGNDILGTNRPEYIGYTNNIKTTYRNYDDLRFFRISLSYKIGGKIKSIDKRSNKNEEELERSQDPG